MTVNAVAFYAIAVLIVLAAAAAVGLPSLRLAGYAGGAVVVLLAVLDIVSGAYALAAVQLVVPGIGAGAVFLVLQREQYRELGVASGDGTRWRIAGPVAAVSGLVLVVTAAVANGWYPGSLKIADFVHTHGALVTVLHYRAPYALVIAVVAVIVTVGAGLVIGRRSADEQTLDQYLAAKREREERARRRRDDREQGRRRAAKVDS
ncbi:MAG: hypothetical protein WCB51_10745 [Candidatus Dormiibacterota bacterium]